jgi:branched-chain amino acid transport system permease protein
MTTLLQLIITGVLVGGVYGLIAMGFVVVYRSGRVFNMAYGQFAMLGAFMAWTFFGSAQAPFLPVPVAVICTILFAVFFGLLVERLIFRHLIGKPVFTSFIITLGLMSLITAAVNIIWGTDIRALPKIIPSGPVYIGDIVLSKEYIWTFGIALVVMLALMFFFQRTRQGLAIRAAYDNQVAARCLGVSAKLNAQIAWVLCSIVATMGGVLLATVLGVSNNLWQPVMDVLAVVLIGGLGSLPGCLAGGLILAIGRNLASYYLGDQLIGIEGVFGLILILVILLIRPNGIFGSKPVERV